MTTDNWPEDWPNPNKLKSETHSLEKASNEALRRTQQVTWSLGATLLLALCFIAFGGVSKWLTSPPITPTPRPTRIVASFPTLANPTADSCQFHIPSRQHNCTQFTQNGALTIMNGSRDQLLLKLTLNPFETGYSQADLAVTYRGEPTNWTINIGDSQTNNGYGGDSGRQSNDAELQIVNGQLAIYGNEGTPASEWLDENPHLLWLVDDFVAADETVHFQISNQSVGWVDGTGVNGRFEHANLFALARQPDSEGDPNYDIYAAFNRTIASSTDWGEGVEWVTLTFSK